MYFKITDSFRICVLLRLFNNTVIHYVEKCVYEIPLAFYVDKEIQYFLTFPIDFIFLIRIVVIYSRELLNYYFFN